MLGNIFIIIAIVAFLMFLDYWLTIKSYAIYSRRYQKKIELEAYELNPNFERQIKKGKYSWRHGLSVVAAALLLLLIYICVDRCKSPFFSTPMLYMAEGMLLSAFTYVNLRHLKNLYLFRIVNNEPGLLKGKIIQSRIYSLKASMSDCFAAFIILLVACVARPNFFMLGFMAGPLIVMLAQIRWIKKKKNDN